MTEAEEAKVAIEALNRALKNSRDEVVALNHELVEAYARIDDLEQQARMRDWNAPADEDL